MELPAGDHRAFRPSGWIEEGLEKLDRIGPIAERSGLTKIQLACQWNLAHPAVECVVPTLIQETGETARPIEEKRDELAALPGEQRLHDEEVEAIRAVGDNRAACSSRAPARSTRAASARTAGPSTRALRAVGARWGIDPERDLAMAASCLDNGSFLSFHWRSPDRIPERFCHP